MGLEGWSWSLDKGFDMIGFLRKIQVILDYV